MYAIILCGGSGTRLWPLSRKNYPKQFLKLYSSYSLLQETFTRIKDAVNPKDIYFITNWSNFFNVYNQIKEIYPEISEKNIFTEPQSLNTLPAISFAMKNMKEKKIKPESPVLIIPSDSYIGKKKEFQTILKSIKKTYKTDTIITLGIKPDYPETGYGYIKKGSKIPASNIKTYKVSSFVEKPDKETAISYLKSKKYLWNSGMYIMSLDTFEKELKKDLPELYDLYEKDLDVFAKDFKKISPVSIDKGLTEKARNILVVEADISWSDVGSFDALYEILPKDEFDNTKNNHIHINSRNILSLSSRNVRITTLNVNDLIIVENKDSILVTKKGTSQDIKKMVEFLNENKCKELDHNIHIYRPWGEYEVLTENSNYKVRKIKIYPGMKIQEQAHNLRSEHWIIISGKADITKGTKKMTLKKDESVFIAPKTKHSIKNKSNKENLEFIEAQTGGYLGEDDIIRFYK